MRMFWLNLLNSFHSWRQILVEQMLCVFSLFYVKIYLIIFIIVNSLNWTVAFIINKNVTQDLIYLHYNVIFGVDLIGSAKKVFIMPLLGLIIILINSVLIFFIYKQEKFIIHLLLSAALLSNLFLLAAIASIYLINFY